ASSAHIGNRELYNGNICRMATSLRGDAPQLTAYTYDQLHRITGMNVASQSISGNVWDDPATAIEEFRTRYSYDANGNILNLQRSGKDGNASSPDMDNLVYHYADDGFGNILTNRLLAVGDQLNATANYANDFEDQATGYSQYNPLSHTYTYDEVGNLIKDKEAEIANIDWTPTGKIKRITREPNSTKPDLEFGYDAGGNRLWKKVIPKNTDPASYTYYMRDAQSNIMATYQREVEATEGQSTAWEERFTLNELHLYGSSRLGMFEKDTTLVKRAYNGDAYAPDAISGIYYDLSFQDSIAIQCRGFKQFELSNHLGNVLAVITDRKISIGTGGAEDWLADIRMTSDYYPFGMKMEGRGERADYRFGFNGKEQDDEVKGEGNSLDFGARIYDSRIGRWLSVDPLASEYPTMSPYVGIGNNPLIFIDPDGRKLQLTFFSDGVDMVTYMSLINKEFEGQFEIQFENVQFDNKTGLVTMEAVIVATKGGGDVSKLSKKAKAFYSEYSGVVNDKKVMAMQKVVNDQPDMLDGMKEATFMGSWRTGALDLFDVQKLDAAGPGGFTTAGVIIHETVEQYEKAKMGLKPGESAPGNHKEEMTPEFVQAHNIAKLAEDKVNGNTQVGKNKVTHEKDGSRTEHIITPNTTTNRLEIQKVNIK
ncbi:MAG: RHS repeat domain-containing protein, partial [Bacteroidia bacterium]